MFKLSESLLKSISEQIENANVEVEATCSTDACNGCDNTCSGSCSGGCSGDCQTFD